jgi:hypothetical protein
MYYYLKKKIRDKHFIQRKPYTCAVLRVDVDNVPYMGRHYAKTVGFAKVCYPDRWDPEYGRQLAERKALFYLADEILGYLEEENG